MNVTLFEIDIDDISTEFDSDRFSLTISDNIFSCLATLLFLLGIIANLIVVRKVYHALRREHQQSLPRHVLVYIGTLVLIDFLLLVNIPFVVADLLIGEWIFGEGLCKFMYCNECINKVLTSFIIAALSFDRLVSVWKFLPPSWRSVRIAKRILFGSIVVSMCLLFPLYLYIRTVDIRMSVSLTNMTSSSRYKCIFDPSEENFDIATIFTMYIFVCGFCLPALFILCSYGTILCYLYTNGFFCFNSHARFYHTTWYVLLLVIIYLFCWTPYWVITVVLVQLGLQNDEGFVKTESTRRITYVVLFMHLLPYLNAVLNPIAYGYSANKQTHANNVRKSMNFSRNETFVAESLSLHSLNNRI